ncbi:MAG: DNA polymerase Y family protein, partial [Burkholderiaceae bacterium]
MHWIALWLPEAQRARWAPLWVAQALRCTPRVAWLDEALVLEVSTSLRLWGGAARLRARLLSGLQAPAADVVPGMAQGVAHGDARPPVLIDAQAPSAQTALGLLRWRAQHHPQDAPRLSPLPDALPLHTLGAARAHLHTLTRLGLRSWGDVRALPRGGVSRRFGAALLQALDEAWGTRPESLPWLSLPDTFNERIELAMATSDAPQMLPAARHLLQALQAWLQARQLGVLAFALEWTLDWRRLHGQDLPAQQELLLRTAEPTADFAVLMRLVHERWQRVRLPAPARDLRL